VWDQLNEIVYTIFHADVHNITTLANHFGHWVYVILFVVIFCETGLVATPILPGDSLLFSVGCVAGLAGSNINMPVMAVVLFVAAVLGDAVNYAAGHFLGPKVFSRDDSWWMNKKHLVEAQLFYEKYGAKTIVLARFVPIVRTFAPFVAGIGNMNYWRFAVYNIVGAVVWINLFLWGGYFFADYAKDRLRWIAAGILIVSVLPMVYEFWNARRLKRAAQNAPPSTTA
jgi:membrane-associated protein